MKTLAIVLAAGFLAVAVAAHAEDADLSAAQGKLREAREILKGAGGGFGGHKEEAIKGINQALDHLEQAQKTDTRKDEKAEHKEKKLEKKDEHLQNRIDQLQKRQEN
jgi:N12 class adenine-specific DNA methylase